MMGPLLERQLIMEDFNDKYPEVVTMMHKELDTCFELLEEQVKKDESDKGFFITYLDTCFKLLEEQVKKMKVTKVSLYLL